jgi:hypothetical protein
MIFYRNLGAGDLNKDEEGEVLPKFRNLSFSD